jgi:DNA-binding protein YbaB
MSLWIDPDEVTREVLAAFAQVRPDGPFLGSAQGVEVEVNLAGEIVDISFAPTTYRLTRDDVLGAAIVSAHRDARESAIAAKQQAVLDVLEKCGIENPGQGWSP